MQHSRAQQLQACPCARIAGIGNVEFGRSGWVLAKLALDKSQPCLAGRQGTGKAEAGTKVLGGEAGVGLHGPGGRLSG
jgi:hypothetical protein